MSIWMQLLFLLCAGLFIWMGVSFIRHHPDLFSKASLEKSFFTTGILTLGLIAFIALLVFLLRHS